MKLATAILPSASLPLHIRAAAFWELAKPRLNTMALLTAAIGFCLGARAVPPAAAAAHDWWRLLHTLLGTFLVAGGSAALNMLAERKPDAIMRRTQERPLPTGRVTPAEALLFGGLSCATGVIYLAATVNVLASVLAATAALVYVVVYTPLKQKTWLCTLVGAIPGAMPPLIGWAAARGELPAGAWILFGIMFLWQLPHFMAIAWLYREDYARAGFPMLPVIDLRGTMTVSLVLVSLLALFVTSIAPVFVGMAGMVYGAAAVVLGAFFFEGGIQLAMERSTAMARRLFFKSLIYLPALLALLFWNSK